MPSPAEHSACVMNRVLCTGENSRNLLSLLLLLELVRGRLFCYSDVVEQQKVLAATTSVADPSFLLVKSQLLESEVIDFGLNVGCEMYLCRGGGVLCPVI